MEFERNAIKLYVFVDNLQYESPHPITVIVNRYKLVRDLKREFAERNSYLESEQYWLFNKQFCYDDMEVGVIVKSMDKYQNGYVVVLFMLTDEDKESINEFIVSFLENRYLLMNFKQRWKDPIGPPCIIADVIVDNQSQTSVGWSCVNCTFLNKPYLTYCQICFFSRPSEYHIPRNYYLTMEDRSYLEKQKRLDIEEKQKEEENKRKMELEKVEHLKVLKNMIKENITVTTEHMECPICTDDIEPGDGLVLHNCFHTVCKGCFMGYLNSAKDPQIKCPYEDCSALVEDREIQEVLSATDYEVYQQLSLRIAETKLPNTFHCKTPNCTAWVVYEDNVHIFPCPICSKNNCLRCAAIHEGQNCTEYQEDLAIKARNDEAAKKDLAFLNSLIAEGKAMKCPGCQLIIQKGRGCDWMQCTMCNLELCWATKGRRWGPKGRGDVSDGCRCGINNKKCSDKCGIGCIPHGYTFGDLVKNNFQKR